MADSATPATAADREFSTITYEVTDRIAVITMDSPENNNGFTNVTKNELVTAVKRADEDDAVRAVVLTGRGRFFCPGADLGAGADTFDEDARKASGDLDDTVPLVDGVRRDGGGEVALAFASMRKPIISAINGAAVGVGSTMLLPTDIRIASSKARFGFVFVRRGICLEATSSWFLPRIVGISKALDWVYSGRVFDAQEALDAGLVEQVVEPEQLLETAMQRAKDIIDNASALSLGVCRQLLWGMLTADSPWEAHRVDSKAISDLGRRADTKEGVVAFLEKRPPEFSLTVPKDYPDYIPPFPDKDRVD